MAYNIPKWLFLPANGCWLGLVASTTLTPEGSDIHAQVAAIFQRLMKNVIT